MFVQDWEPVVLTKKHSGGEPKKNTPPQKKQTSVNSQTVKSDIPAYKLEKDDCKLNVVTSSMAQQIIDARNSKKWNQEVLARQSQVPLDIIKKYEKPTSTTVIMPQYVQKLTKALGVQIKK